MARRWYIDSSGAVVSWAAAVAGGTASRTILEVIETDPALPPVIQLWAPLGFPVSSEQVAIAQALASADPIPPQRPPERPVGSAGGGGIVAYAAAKAYGANEIVLYADRLFRAKVATTGNVPRTDGTADAFWMEVSPAAPVDLSGKQDAATAATDAELAAAIAGKKRSWSFSKSGALAVANGTHRLYNRTGHTIILGEVHASVHTAPAGAAVNTALAKNGTAITGAAPSIAAAANEGAVTGLFTWESGSYLSLNITQVGSTTAGEHLVVTFTEA